MQNDKERLEVDLGFLDKAKPQAARESEAAIKSGYKTNWRNIAVIGGLIVAVIIWVAAEDNSPSNRSAPASYSAPPTYQPQAQPNNAAGEVENGQFRCSSYDSRQADLLAPISELEIKQEENHLTQYGEAIESLKRQMATRGVTENSDQATIDGYNAMVSRHNAQIEAYRTAITAHEARIDRYNQQVQTRNTYLETHCRRSR